MSRSGFCQLPVARDAVCHPAIMGLPPLQNSKEWSQGPRVASEDGQEESHSSRTTDAMLTALCCCWRGLLSGPSGGDTILYPRVARGRPVSTTGHRQPISVVAAAPQPPHIVTCDLSHYINAHLNIAPTSVTVIWPWLQIWNIKWKFNIFLLSQNYKLYPSQSQYSNKNLLDEPHKCPCTMRVHL